MSAFIMNGVSLEDGREQPQPSGPFFVLLNRILDVPHLGGAISWDAGNVYAGMYRALGSNDLGLFWAALERSVDTSSYFADGVRGDLNSGACLDLMEMIILLADHEDDARAIAFVRIAKATILPRTAPS